VAQEDQKTLRDLQATTGKDYFQNPDMAIKIITHHNPRPVTIRIEANQAKPIESSSPSL
jgi:hypothetical protein